MNLSLAYSPCPNDTFIFHAMINGLVDTEGLSFTPHLHDVEELNSNAMLDKFEICKLSYHAFFQLSDRYRMLRSGSALGYNNGPLLVCRRELQTIPNDAKVAIPGNMTTGALLLKIIYPHLSNTHPILFSDIADRLLDGSFDAGVLIHEGRFTYSDRGLRLIADLGQAWQERHSSPIPLGGIAVSRKIPDNTTLKIDRVLKRSILFAKEHPQLSEEYIHQNAKEIEHTIQKKHIDLFVNNFSIDIGAKGEEAVQLLYREYLKTTGKSSSNLLGNYLI